MPTIETFPSDIDAEIKSLLSNYQVQNEQGVNVAVPVFYTSPEVEIQVETHPSIVFYQANMSPDPSRMFNNTVEDDLVKDANGNVTSLTKRDQPDPYILWYDIRIYTLFQQDSKFLEKSIMTTFPMRGSITVNGYTLDMFFTRRKDLAKGPESLNSSSMKILEKSDQREQIISLMYKVYTSFDVHAKTSPIGTAQGVTYTVNPK